MQKKSRIPALREHICGGHYHATFEPMFGDIGPVDFKGIEWVVIGSVTDGYLPREEQFQNTRKLLEQLKGSGAEILICTKSDLVVRDIELLREIGTVTVSWSINTLDEKFRADMNKAANIERRLCAMKQVYDAGIRTVCFIAPVFPGIMDFETIFHRVKISESGLAGEHIPTGRILTGDFRLHPGKASTFDHPVSGIYQKGGRSYFPGP